KALPADVALVDFLFYIRHDHAQKDPKKRYQKRLTAFVVRHDEATVRLDLGPAQAVEAAVAAWRTTLGQGRDAQRAAALLRRTVWLPLQKHLKGAKVVLLSPDGALAELPFAALPGSKPDSYLIEDVALAVLPAAQALPDLLGEVTKGGKPKAS